MGSLSIYRGFRAKIFLVSEHKQTQHWIYNFDKRKCLWWRCEWDTTNKLV